MKRKSAITFIVSAVLIVIFAYLLLNGLPLGKNYRLAPLKENIKLGLDLKGGVYIEEKIVDKNVNEDAVNRTKELLEMRVNTLGVTESQVSVTGQNRIRIEIPGIYDAKDALEAVGKTGELKFIGPDGNVILTGKDVEDASVGIHPDTSEPLVILKLKSEGAKKFADATSKNIGKRIQIMMDEEVVSAPQVQEAITGGEATITGSEDIEKAKWLAGVIKSGALPVKLAPAFVKTIGASLGADAIPTSVKAAIIGISLVMIFMLIYYKLPGLIADFALTVYIMLTLLIYTEVLKATLTLPGIAGLLLSIGMAVDANVLIFERIKEELKVGKSLKTAIDSGFHRALTSILDSNITTLIAGFVLLYLGSGGVKGFALTLITGILCSMFTAITVTRFLLKSFVNAEWVKNTKFYGA